jgi:hypothetical protein
MLDLIIAIIVYGLFLACFAREKTFHVETFICVLAVEIEARELFRGRHS